MKKNILQYTLILTAMFVTPSMLAACQEESSGGATTATTPTEASGFASCRAIIEACHEVDEQTAGQVLSVHECHEHAHHATSEEACAAEKEDCVAQCMAIAHDAGAPIGEHDASPPDSGADAAPPHDHHRGH